MKSSFKKAKLQKSDDFKRDTGISLDNFFQIISLVENHIKKRHKKNPNLAKGVKPSLSVSDRVLLTIYYIRHHPTFVNLGDNFGISESYANKIYHYILNILVKELHVKGNKELLNKDLDTIVIDVSEQEIERPVKKQKDYYSGKKKSILLKFK